MSLDRLVNVVCHRLLNQPLEERQARVFNPVKEHKPFDLSEYEISREQKDLARFMIARGIHKSTQEAFAPYMFVATKKREDGKRYGNIAFPLRKPDDLTKIIGLEVRGFPNKEEKPPIRVWLPAVILPKGYGWQFPAKMICRRWRM